MIEVKTAGELGYCSGVSRAIDKAIKAAKGKGDLHTLGTLAHNEVVVDFLEKHSVFPLPQGHIPVGCNIAITAHGAPPETYDRLKKLACQVVDCTCPIVKKAQIVVRDLASDKFDIVIFGEPEHQEVRGLVGWAMGHTKFVGDQRGLFTPGQEHKELDLGKRVGVVSQTTKSPADYADFIDTVVRHHLEGFQELKVLNTICPIVAERIAATRKLAGEVDMMFVVGSKESANTRNLERACLQALEPFKIKLIQNETQVEDALNEYVSRVGVTAGTSTPIEVVEGVIEVIQETWTKQRWAAHES
jgi:4-hydroxy-3-methylbut-2-enyl diphosphate reductase